MTMRRALAIGLVAAVCAVPQQFDREKSAREYIQFLVLQLDQWTKEFPQQFYAAMMKPPVDSTKISEGAKAGPSDFIDAVLMMTALSKTPDIATNTEFREHGRRTLSALKEMNQAMAAQRFPAVLQSSWDQIRSTLNNLARVYQVETLAVLDPPAAGGGRGSAPASKATGAVPGGVAGYIVDLSCAKRGKGMWANAECIARCIRDGDRAVLVTDNGKIYQISNQDKIPPESYGQVVTLVGK